MNRFNLIDPFSPQEQIRFRRWIANSAVLIAIFIAGVFGYSAKIYYDIYVLKNKIAVLRLNGSLATLENYEQLSSQCITLKQQLKTAVSWQKAPLFYNHFTMISEKIPATLMLESLVFNEEIVHMEGYAQSLETLLGFIHELNVTELFYAMNLVELKPSTIFCDEKKLVNFIIKGKLKVL